MNYTFEVKTISNMTGLEVFETMQLRQDVFIVEQNCIYRDIDNTDLTAQQTLLKNKGKIVGTTRIYQPDIQEKRIHIGRVVIHKNWRNKELGHLLMCKNIEYIRENKEIDTIEISAQSHLQDFYSTHSFVTVGKEYLEDGIPHVKMILKFTARNA